ncbi:MAG: VWA domain-containing protein [Dehalococcoidales bacterium]|nr:VWA domain-containing protein [Dehalococcoidales bacterium]
MKKFLRVLSRVLLPVLLITSLLVMPASAAVTPDTVIEELLPGEVLVVEKTVDVPEIPPLPDVYFLADTTGSMGPAIANVQANASTILATISGLDPTAQFGAGDYKDFPFDAYAFQNSASIDGAAPALAAIGAWGASGGADGPEGWFYALYQLATDPAIGWRPGSSRIVVIFGDAPAHDPVPAAATVLGFDLDEATVTAALQAANVHVIAVSLDTSGGVFYPAGLDDNPNNFGGDYAAAYGIVEDGSAGQASRIAAATNGAYLFAASADEVSDAILAGLTALSTDVWATVEADPGLNVTLEPAVHFGVPSGTSVSFTETISIDADAPCGVYEAVVTFWANSYPEEGTPIGRELIRVGDFTAPVVSCEETVNPHGQTVPPAGSTTLPGPKGGQNEDGFYKLFAEDNCDPDPEIFVSGFGPFHSGDVVKITEDPDAIPEMKKMGSTKGQAGAVAAHLILNSDPVITAVDHAGNVSDPADCLVPPAPK